MESYRVAAVIPAFNESDTIYDVVTGVKNFCDVFVVDDHSSDETFNLANKAGGKVYKNQGKSGYENALNYGYSKVSNLGYDYIKNFINYTLANPLTIYMLMIKT